MANWPSTVPHQPLADSFRKTEPHTPPHETEFEGGAYRRRPSSTISRELYSVTWEWTDAQFKAFRTFYHTTLGDGSLSFTMSVFVEDQYASRTCQFKGMYQATRPDNLWRVSAELYVFG